MNAYVEVATAEVVAQTEKVTALVAKAFYSIKVAIAKVATSTERLEMLRYSINKVAPNTFILGGTA